MDQATCDDSRVLSKGGGGGRATDLASGLCSMLRLGTPDVPLPILSLRDFPGVTGHNGFVPCFPACLESWEVASSWQEYSFSHLEHGACRVEPGQV